MTAERGRPCGLSAPDPGLTSRHRWPEAATGLQRAPRGQVRGSPPGQNIGTTRAGPPGPEAHRDPARERRIASPVRQEIAAGKLYDAQPPHGTRPPYGERPARPGPPPERPERQNLEHIDGQNARNRPPPPSAEQPPQESLPPYGTGPPSRERPTRPGRTNSGRPGQRTGAAALRYGRPGVVQGHVPKGGRPTVREHARSVLKLRKHRSSRTPTVSGGEVREEGFAGGAVSSRASP